MKFVLNKCYGGFSLSNEAWTTLGDECAYDRCAFDYRNDEDLVNIVEKLGEKANGSCAKLVIVNLPKETTDYAIDDYDGYERIVYVVDGKLWFL